MLKTFAAFALIATVLATSGCYHHHSHDRDDGWRDRDHRHSYERDRYDRDDRRHDDRHRNWR